MKTVTKLMLAAIPAALVATPAMAAGDSESLNINLNGSVASECSLTPNGSVDRTLNMASGLPQVLESVALVYSCNSPYKVTLKSQNGGMEHQESSGAFKIAYDVIVTGTGVSGFTDTYAASALTGGGEIIVENNDWLNIWHNGGANGLTFDLNFNPGLIPSDYQVAGTYKDTLTVTVAANL